MIRARFSPKAARDLDEISGYIATDNPEAAARVRRTRPPHASAEPFSTPPIFSPCILKLEGASASPTARHLQIRWFVVPNFRNYLIFYQPHQESMVVVRVLHAAQDWTRFFPVA